MPLTRFGGIADLASGIQTFQPHTASSAGAWPAANRAIFCLVRPKQTRAVSAIQFFVGTQSGNVDVGVYTHAGGTMTRLASAGSTACGAGSAVQSINLSAPVLLVAGRTYYLALSCDNTTATFARQASASSAINTVGDQMLFVASSFPLDASHSGAAGSSFTPWLYAS